MTEYIEVSLEDYNNKTRLIKKQEGEILNLKKEIADLEEELNLLYSL